MIYLIGELKLFMLAAFVIGALVGWGSCVRDDEDVHADEGVGPDSRPLDLKS